MSVSFNTDVSNDVNRNGAITPDLQFLHYCNNKTDVIYNFDNLKSELENLVKCIFSHSVVDNQNSGAFDYSIDKARLKISISMYSADTQYCFLAVGDEAQLEIVKKYLELFQKDNLEEIKIEDVYLTAKLKEVDLYTQT